MNYDADFCQQIRVSEAEKRECLERVSEILSLASTARNYGLLSLGKEAEENTSFLLLGTVEQLNSVHPPEIKEIQERGAAIIAELKDQEWVH